MTRLTPAGNSGTILVFQGRDGRFAFPNRPSCLQPRLPASPALESAPDGAALILHDSVKPSRGANLRGRGEQGRGPCRMNQYIIVAPVCAKTTVFDSSRVGGGRLRLGAS